MCKKVIYLITFVGVLGLVIGVANAVPFQQDFGPDGIVSIEAENYDANVPQGGDTWELVGPTGGFTGTAGMQALPNDDAGTRKTNYAARCPRLDYQINFVRTGTHYVWVRGYGASGNDDSCHVGLDGREINTCDNMSGWTNNYTWSNNTLDGQRGTFEVTPAGIHTLNIWMREDGFIIDKIVLTTNVDFTPTGDGPPESVRGQPAQVQAYNPKPAYLATDVPDVLTLSWTPGENAVQHDVYFGTDFNDVNNATVSTASIYRGRQDSNSFLPAEVPLEMKRTYYWRIDEIRSGQPDSPVKGKVWSFTTGDFITGYSTLGRMDGDTSVIRIVAFQNLMEMVQARQSVTSCLRLLSRISFTAAGNRCRLNMQTTVLLTIPRSSVSGRIHKIGPEVTLRC